MYVRGRSLSTHRDAENENESTISMPRSGDTAKEPEVGGELTTTTMDAAAVRVDAMSEHVSVNVSVAPFGNVLAGRTRLKMAGELDTGTVVLIGTRESAPRGYDGSLTDHEANTGCERTTEALSTSLEE